MGMAYVYVPPRKVVIRRNSGGSWTVACNCCGAWATYTYWPEAIIRARSHAARQSSLRWSW